jgi:neutral ceramidase
MGQRMIMGVWLSSLFLAAGTYAGELANSAWKAGAACVNITPENLMWMSGYSSRNKPAEGKLHDLKAKALVLEDPTGNRAVLITMDLVGIPRDLSVAVANEIQKKHGLARESIMLSVSHTHTGPVVRRNLDSMYNLDETQRKNIDDYTARLHANLVQVVGEALAHLEPVQLRWGIGQATFAVNRRNNKEGEVPQLLKEGKLKGPVDHDVPVLTVYDAKEKLKVIVCGYACHATVLSFYQWSGDYPGFAQLELEKTHPGATAMFWAGCGGDQNPLPRRTVALAEHYGRLLAEGVETALQKSMQSISGNLAATYTEIDLPFADLPSREELVKNSASPDRYIAARAKSLLRQIDEKGSLSGTYPYPIQVWQLGPEVTWVALGGEVVVDYSIRLKQELGPQKTWVAGYTNDVMAYIPSLRVLKEGGYEGGGAMVYYGLPTVWSPKIEERIVEAVYSQVKKVRANCGRSN